MPDVSSPKVGKYTLGRTLGKGGSAKVKTALDEATGEAYAIKLQKKGVDAEDEARNEVKVMSALRDRCDGVHPESVVELHEVMESGKYLYLVMDKVDGGDLLEQVLAEPLDEANARWVFREVATALSILKTYRIAHRDVKPDNIFVDFDTRTAKLGDFGLASIDTPRCTDAVGTPSFAAPELLHAGACSYCPYTADCYSLAVAIYASLTQETPSRRGVDWSRGAAKRLSRPLADLLSAALVDDPAARPTIDDILAHPWFAGDCSSSVDDDEYSSA